MTIDLDDIAVGMALVERSGRMRQVNRSFARFLGYARDTLESMRFQDITVPEDLDADLALFEELLAGRRDSYRMQKRYVTAEGRIVWADLMVRAQRDVNGQLERVVSTIIDIDAQKRREASLEKEAAFDGLTGLLRRGPFRSAVREALQRCAETGSCLAFLVIDMDGLKAINDAEGHGVGDAAIKAAASHILATSRGHGVAGRIGGDEFALFTRAGLNRAEAKRYLAEMSDALARPFAAEDVPYPLTVSVGTARAPDDGLSLEALSTAADRRLYEAKNARPPRLIGLAPPGPDQPPRPRVSNRGSMAEKSMPSPSSASTNCS